MKTKLMTIGLVSLMLEVLALVLAGTVAYKAMRAEAMDKNFTIAPGSLSHEIVDVSSSTKKLARTSDGVLHVVYTRSDGFRFQIYHSHSSNGGETWTEEPLTSESCGDQTSPAIAVDSNDYLHIVWQGCSSNSLNHSQIRYKKFIISWNSVFDITADADWDQRIPNIAIDSNDNLHIFWQKIEFIGGSWCTKGCGPIYYSKYERDKGSWSASQRVGENYQYNEIKIAVAIDKNNYIHLAWSSGGYRNASCWHSAYRQYTNSWQPIKSFECYITDPSIAVDSENNIHLVSGFGAYSSDVRHYKKTASGWQDPEIIAPNTSGRKISSIAIDSNDYLHIVWNDNQSVKYRKFTSLWEDAKTLVSNTNIIYPNPNLIWAWNPEVGGERTNIPKNGYAFVFNNESDVKFYKSGDLEWGTLSDNQPPAISDIKFNGSSSNELPSGTTKVTISFQTNEVAECRYSTLPNIFYDSMGLLNNFSTADGLDHSKEFSGLADGTTYNYYAKCKDSSGNASGDYLISFSVGAGNQPPSPPDKNYLLQFKSDGITQIKVGETVEEDTVIFKSKVSDPDGDKVKLEVELRNLNEYDGKFDETKEGFKKSESVASGEIVSVSFSGLINENYHWRARVIDEYENKSEWVEFGENDTSEADFVVRKNKECETLWRKDIKPGDILNAHGTDIFSNINPGHWDHSAIYVGDILIGKEYQPFLKDVQATPSEDMLKIESAVIEAYPEDKIKINSNKGVWITSIGSWDHKPEVELLRVDADDETKKKAISFALSHVGDSYSLINLIKEPNEPPWYCSELVWASYYNASNGEIDIDPPSEGIIDYISPQGIHDSTYNNWISGYKDFNQLQCLSKWSFAVITDLHIGWGIPDYGKKGWENTEPGQEYYLTARLIKTVEWINKHYKNSDQNIKFVAVLGDISDTAEYSEFLKAREVLNQLEIPYIPLIGNHDVLSYVQKITAEPDYRFYKKEPSGDDYFEEIFWTENITNTQKIQDLFNNSFRRQEELPEYSGDPFFQNYTFSYEGINFIALDFAKRELEGMPILHTEISDWSEDKLKKGKDQVNILFSHFPLNKRWGGDYFSLYLKIKPFLEKYLKGGCKIYNFAGHTHANSTTAGKCDVIETDALAQVPVFPFYAHTNKYIRLIEVLDNNNIKEVNCKMLIELPLDANPPAINPYFTVNKEKPAVGEEIIFQIYSKDLEIENIYFYELDFGDKEKVNSLNSPSSCRRGTEWGTEYRCSSDGICYPILVLVLANYYECEKKYSQPDNYKVTLKMASRDNPNYIEDLSWNFKVEEKIKPEWKILLPIPGIFPFLNGNKGIDLTQQANAQRTSGWVEIDRYASPAKPVGAFNVHFENATDDIDLSNLVADIDANQRKSILHMPVWPDIIDKDKILFIPSMGTGEVYICPNATSLEEVNLNCQDKTVLKLGETKNGMTLSLTDYEGNEYYMVYGVTGTGGGESEEEKESNLESQISITRMLYGGEDILNAVTQAIGNNQAPLLLSELKESKVDLEDYTSSGKLNPGQKKKLKMKFKFLETAGNEYQGKSINVNFKFLAMQEEQ